MWPGPAAPFLLATVEGEGEGGINARGCVPTGAKLALHERSCTQRRGTGLTNGLGPLGWPFKEASSDEQVGGVEPSSMPASDEAGLSRLTNSGVAKGRLDVEEGGVSNPPCTLAAAEACSAAR